MKMWPIQSHDQIVQLKKLLEEDQERFDHFLVLLEEWINYHFFLPKNYDKRMLPVFLRNCKYNLEKTKQKLELYFVYKKRYPETCCFHEFNDAEKQGLKNYYIYEASKLTPEGYRVHFAGFRSSVTSGCDMNVVNKILAMFCTYKSNFDPINCGLIVVVDVQHFSPAISSGILNSFFKRLMVMVQKVYPFRVSGIYVTFLPRFAIPMVNMIKMLFNEKMRSRFYMETGYEQMKKNIPMYCLPKEYGGTDGTINENAAKFMQEIMRAKLWFLEQEKIQMMGDIPKQLYETSEIDDNFGMQGSFRKLNLD